MSDPDTLEDWVEEEFDPEEETPLEFVKGHEFPNAAAAAIALDAARRLDKEFIREEPESEATETERDDDVLPLTLDRRTGRLREERTGRFIGWVRAAIKYIGEMLTG